MKKIIILNCGIIFLLLLASCKKEERLTASGIDKDWYSIQDSSDPINHLIYNVFNTTGISIFYNDTLGKQYRGTSLRGDTIIHYEKLDFAYAIENTNTSPPRYTIAKTKTNLQSGITFVRDSVIPALKVYGIVPRSFLMVDTLSVYHNGYKPAGTYKGLTSTMVSYLRRLDGMTSSAKVGLKNEILSSEITTLIMDNYIKDLADFFAVSNNIYKSSKITNLYNITISPYNTYPKNQSDYKIYGFLNYNIDAGYFSYGSSSFGYTTPTMQQDVTSFVKAVLTDNTFTTTYQSNSYLLKKYNLMKALLNKIKKV